MVDAAKLKSARAGNARARAAVVRSLQDGWFRYALSQLLSVSAARDATQEAGLRVLLRLSAYDGVDPPDVWSMGAAVAAVREVRAHGGTAPPLLAAARGAGLSADPPKFRRQVTDAADGLTAVLSPMTAEQREAVVLRLVDRRPTAVVANLLGVDPAAVRAAATAALRDVARPVRPQLDRCRDWSDLAHYPGDLRVELFRADRPRWLVPGSLGLLAVSAGLITLAHRNRPPPTTGPATTQAATAGE